MKNLFYICLLLFCMACEENKSVDPTLMPEATAIGANTFGCLVDGWVYTSGRWSLPTTESLVQEGSIRIGISAEVGFESHIQFLILNPKEGETSRYINASFDNQSIEDGKVHISRMSGGIFSGTFEGGRITKGRFDMKYKE